MKPCTVFTVLCCLVLAVAASTTSGAAVSASESSGRMLAAEFAAVSAAAAAGVGAEEKQSLSQQRQSQSSPFVPRTLQEMQQLPEWTQGKFTTVPPHPSLPTTKQELLSLRGQSATQQQAVDVVTGGTPAPTKAPLNLKCQQSLDQTVFSGWLHFFMGMVPAVGNYDYCIHSKVKSEYCTAKPVFGCVTEKHGIIYSPNVYVLMSMTLSGIGVGLCVPPADVCSTADLNIYLQAQCANKTFAPEIYVPMDAVYGYNNRSKSKPNGAFVDGDLLASFNCSAEYSFSTLVAACERDKQKWYEDGGARAVAGIFFFLIFLVVLATFLAALNSAYKGWQVRKAEEDVYDNVGDCFGSPGMTMESYKGELTMLNVYDGSSQAHQSPRREELFSPSVRNMIAYFDARCSLSDLFTVKSRNVHDIDTRFFEGIRTTAMLFVIYGHTLYFPQFTVGFSNTVYALQWLNTYPAIGVMPAVLAVDTFFFLSGFLFMHLYLKSVHKDHQKRLDAATDDEPEPKLRPIGVVLTLKMYVHRYLRLTPLVMAVLVLSTWLFEHMPTGPLAASYTNGIFFDKCREYWWHQLLYITNLGGAKHGDWASCVGWFWYLSCDMQMFLVGPIIAASYVLFPPIFYMLVAAGVFGSAAGAAVNTVYLHQMEYIKTWYRAAPYVYGFLAAVLVRNETIRSWMRRLSIRMVFYLLSVGFLVSSINLVFYLNHPTKKDDMPFQHFAHAWSFICWGLGWTLVVIPWACGHGSFLPKFLSHNFFAIASKLTFGCYLIHPVIMTVVSASSLTLPFFTPLTFYYYFAGFAVWAFISAIGLWIVVEFPFSQMNNALTK